MLHAKDLMIGDYVGFLPTWKNEDGTIQRDGNPNNPIICKVQMLGSSSAQLDNGEDYFDADDIELYPIPLTPEILEKNGWSEDYNEDADWFGHHFPEDKELMLEIHVIDKQVLWKINCGEYVIMPLNYVHELQNAIRLCGIEKEIEL